MEANRLFGYFSAEAISLIFGLRVEERCRAGLQIFHRKDTSSRYYGLKSWAKSFRRNESCPYSLRKTFQTPKTPIRKATPGCD